MLGASVDGYVNCSCCGSEILGKKCPFSHRDSTLSEYALSENSCITYSSEKSTYVIKPKHFYHTQVQHQMFVTGVEYADFVVYLQKVSCIIRITSDTTYTGTLCAIIIELFQLTCTT